MKKKLIQVLVIVVPIIIAIVCLWLEIANNVQAFMAVPLELKFSGEYSKDGENWYPYNENVDISALDGDVTVKGHFDSDIFEGAILNLYCNHIGVSIYINGELFYIDSPTEIKNYGIDLIPSMCGKRWEQVLCPDITMEDDVEFRFINYHKYGNENAYKEVLSSLFITPQDTSILEVYLKSYIEPFEMAGYALLIVAAMLLGASLSAIVFRSSMAKRLFKIGITTLFAGGYILLDVMIIYLEDELLVVKTYGAQLCMMLAVYFIGMMVCDILKGGYKKIANILMVCSCALNVVIMLFAIIGNVLIYDMLLIWEIAQYIISSILIIVCVLELIKEKKYKMEHILYICMNIAIIVNMTGVGSGMYYSGMCFKASYVLMLIMILFIGVKQVILDHQASIKNEKLKAELEQSRISVMLSQIQPHFLYNSLTSVMDLCDTNPKQAKMAIADFADYLRGNLSSLKTEKPVSFEIELEHIKKYLKLEKLRFQDELEIVYDIKTQDFMLPALTVQPLIENAVKHGVGQKIGGGTVVISTYETENDYIICIKDDGVGFENGEYANDGGTHIGIENTKKRLRMIMNAKLEIESKKGEGTTVNVLVPKRRD